MKKHTAIFLIVFYGSIFAVSAGAAGNAENGKVLYKKTCVGCHRPKGEGIPPMVPPLNGERAKQMTDERLFQKIVKGVPGTGMPPYEDTYSAEQIYDLVSYIRELQK